MFLFILYNLTCKLIHLLQVTEAEHRQVDLMKEEGLAGRSLDICPFADLVSSCE